jgi:hypothetical protein
MPKSLDENARNQPTNPPFSSGLPLYKGEERWWVGWVQPNINPTSTHPTKLCRLQGYNLIEGDIAMRGMLIAKFHECLSKCNLLCMTVFQRGKFLAGHLKQSRAVH